MSIGVCIPCCNRKEYLRILLTRLPRYLIETDRLTDFRIYAAIPTETDRPFNAALARNIAALAAIGDGHEELVLQDVDVYPQSGVTYVRHGVDVDWFLSAGGCKVSTKHFLQANGWNPRFAGWGDEDTEFFHRLHNISPTDKWSYMDEAKHALVVNLEWTLDGLRSDTENANYWGHAVSGPRFVKYRGHVDRPSKYDNWHLPDLRDENHRLWETIQNLPFEKKMDYFANNGLNLISASSVTMEDARFVTRIFYSPDKVFNHSLDTAR